MQRFLFSAFVTENMETRNIVFLWVVLGDLLVLHSAEGLQLKGGQLNNGEGGKGFQRIYHSPTDARNIPYSPTVAKDIPGLPPSQPYLDKLLRLVSRVNERHENEQKWRNLKVLDEQERNFMSDSDVEASGQKVEEELRKTGSRGFASDEVPYRSGQLAKQGDSKEKVENINLKRKVENEKEEDEQENGDGNEEQEDEGEIDKEKDEENKEDESNEVIDEEEEGSKGEGNEDEEGEKSESNKNVAGDKRRLMALLMRELKDLETENSQVG